MGMKLGMLVTAIGIAMALRAWRKKQHTVGGGQAASSHHNYLAGGAALGAAALGGTALYQHHQASKAPSLRDPALIYQRLVQCVLDKRLQPFYPPGNASANGPNLHMLANHLANSGALEQIAQRYRLPEVHALDLVKLALFEVIILVDDSSSIRIGNRQAEMQQIVTEVAHIADCFDSSGIEIRFLNSSVQGNNIRDDQQVAQILQSSPPNGRTPMGRALRDKILFPLVIGKAQSRQLFKPVLILIATDGAATDTAQDTVPNVVLQATNTLRQAGLPDSIFFSFCQVGDDQDAVRFLESLDNDPQIGNMIDVTSSPQIESQQILKGFDKKVKNAPPEWHDMKHELKRDPDLFRVLFLLKRLLGPIDPFFDSSDESGQKRSMFGSDEPVYKQHWSEDPSLLQQQQSRQLNLGYQFSPQGQQPPMQSFDNQSQPSYDQQYNQQAQPSYNQPSYSSGYGQPSPYQAPYAESMYNQQPAYGQADYSQPANNYSNREQPIQSGYGQDWSQDQNNYGPPPQAEFTAPSNGYGPPADYGQPSYDQNYGHSYGQQSSYNQQPANGFAFPQP